MAEAAFLERFDAPASPASSELPAEQQPGYESGFLAGQAAANAAQEALNAQLIEKLNEITFVYAEARSNILQSLKPLFEALVDKLFPDLLDAVNQARVIDALHTAASSDTSVPTSLFVNPQNAHSIANALPSELSIPFEIKEDPTLTEGEIRIAASGTNTSFNTEQLYSEISELLSATILSHEEFLQNG